MSVRPVTVAAARHRAEAGFGPHAVPPADIERDDRAAEAVPSPDAPAMQTIMRLHKLSRWLMLRGWRRLSVTIDRIIRVVYAARIPAEAEIDPSVHFSHNALAVVVTKKARIGPRCQIGMHVLLGSRWPLEGGPRLEADVIVHAGAKIIGPVTVGAGSVVGANAVVLEDIPPRSLAVGVPAVVKRSNLSIDDYRAPANASDAD
jgi:serine O-acetyltransferase